MRLKGVLGKFKPKGVEGDFVHHTQLDGEFQATVDFRGECFQKFSPET